jgi:prepilin-type N-terminal cleavage/methylation domain-containing protein
MSSVGNKLPRRCQPPAAGWAGQAGVTLLELVIALTILALLVGLAAPTLGHWLDDWKLREAAERVAQTLRYARTRALFEQRYYVVELRREAPQVRVLEPSSDFVREYALPQEVEWVEADASLAPGTIRLLFPPSGAVEQRDLWLRNTRGSRARIHVNFLLGTPEVEFSRRGS